MYNKRTQKCKWCGNPILTHKKCKVCEILLHEENDDYTCTGCIEKVQHTLVAPDRKHCIPCFNKINI